MHVEATFHHSFPKNAEMFSVLASKQELAELLIELDNAQWLGDSSRKLIEELRSWGIGS